MLKMKIDFININSDKLPKKSGYNYYFVLQDKHSVEELKTILKKYLLHNLRKGNWHTMRKIRFCGMERGHEENVGFRAQEEVGLATPDDEGEYWSSCLDFHSLYETCLFAIFECNKFSRYSEGHLTIFYDDIDYVYDFFDFNRKNNFDDSYLQSHLKRRNRDDIRYIKHIKKQTRKFCKYVRLLIDNKKKGGYQF